MHTNQPWPVRLARDELAALQSRYASTGGHARLEVDAHGKVLHSLLEYEAGLRVFVQRPEVPPDNNAAERALRGAVIARYTSFGSGSADGAQLTERMYSIYATLQLAGLNPYTWTRDYLEACARNGRQRPADLGPWLPWRMDAARRAELSLPPTAHPVALPAPAEPSVASLLSMSTTALAMLIVFGTEIGSINYSCNWTRIHYPLYKICRNIVS